jgi:hypothetical protein
MKKATEELNPQSNLKKGFVLKVGIVDFFYHVVSHKVGRFAIMKKKINNWSQ